MCRSIVAKISRNIHLDSDVTSIRRNSEVKLNHELSLASHLGLGAVSISMIGPTNVTLARSLASFIRNDFMPIKIWIHLPMSLAPNKDRDPDSPRHSPWYWWSQFVTLASDVSDSFGVVLDLPRDIPEEYVIQRWLSEPVVCLRVGTDLFLTNSSGFPVLSPGHQQLLRRFFKLKVQVVITGSERNSRGYPAYSRYIHWLWKTGNSPTLLDEQSQGLDDQLQEPLQPLRDNLSSTTYAIFEQDPYKYAAYEEAIYLALVDRKPTSSVLSASNGPTPNGDSPPTHPPIIVAVLGAGRGPLVQASLTASKRAYQPIRVYVVEKNVNAVVTLQDRLAREWTNEDVHLYHGDMRTTSLPEKVDIFVSELLGSFGDNELSPECLDGAQRYLKDEGISIPCSYTSYLAPFQSLQFYNETKRLRTSAQANSILESPFVVRLLNHRLLDQPQSTFTFVHPKTGIHPDRHSKEMISWFPFVFPLDKPVHVRGNESVQVNLWRVTTSKHVWYEWALTEPLTTRIHNLNGSAYRMEL